MGRRALMIAMILLAASASQAIAIGQLVNCQLSGVVVTQGLTAQRFNRTLPFNFDDSGGQLISGINGVLATTLGYSDREIVGQLRDIALTGGAAPSLFGNPLDSLDVSQANFIVDRMSGNAFLSATFHSGGVVFAVGPCGPVVPPSMLLRRPYGAERD